MIGRSICATLISAALLLSGCATTPAGTRTVTVAGADDQLEDTIYIDTQSYWVIPYQSEHFFRAYINKQTKDVQYQIYAQLRAPQWVYWDEIRFIEAGELRKVDAIRIASDVTCDSGYGCIHYEDVGAYLTRDQIQLMADNPTIIRFSGRVSGLVEQFTIDQQELRALLAQVDAYIN